MQKKIIECNRRQFVGAASTIAAAAFLPLSSRAHTNKLKIGVIGTGWYGMVDLKAAFEVGGVECLAICDVDSAHLEKSANDIHEWQGYAPLTFKNYQDLLDVDGLEAVIIATPPHWHALQFLAALERGLDIYCEKPLAYDIREGQIMVEAAEKSDRIVQVGFQRRMSQAIRDAREFIADGNIGNIVQVDVQIHYTHRFRDTTIQEPPASLDWDAWCGPAPKLPYCPNIGHFAWRLEKAYGNGHLVDWGIHMIDATRWILDESMPQAVHAFGGNYLRHESTTPDSMTANFDFQTCPVTWRHRLWGAQEYTPSINNGILFFGEKGTVFVSDRRWEYIPQDRNAERVEHKVQTDAGKLLMQNFLDVVKSRQKPQITPRDGFYSTATTQLGMIALQANTPVEWDLQAMQITNHTAAAQLLKREYRKPYQHPYSG